MTVELSRPGDPDLVFDIDGLNVTSVVTDGHEVLMMIRGGHGWWITDGERHDVDVMEEGEMRLAFPSMSGTPLFDQYVDQLEQWRDAATTLRLCSAPGRVASIIQDRGTWLPIPFRPFPETGDES